MLEDGRPGENFAEDGTGSVALVEAKCRFQGQLRGLRPITGIEIDAEGKCDPVTYGGEQTLAEIAYRKTQQCTTSKKCVVGEKRPWKSEEVLSRNARYLPPSLPPSLLLLPSLVSPHVLYCVLQYPEAGCLPLLRNH